jgi:arginine utilization protein RocB
MQVQIPKAISAFQNFLGVKMTASNFNEDYLHLTQSLTVRAITGAHQEMLEFIKTKSSMTIELPEDCQVDLSFVQLVEAARVYAGTAGKHIALAKPAQGQLLDVLTRGGFLEGMSADDMKFWLHEGGIQ